MRKVEFGAGIAAAVLSLAALGMLLFAPLVPYCGVRVQDFAACPDLRHTSLAHAGLDTAGWAFIAAMLLITLAGAAGAIGEACFGARVGAYAAWIGAALAFAACAYTAGGIGLLYLPTVLALCLAAYASIVQRMRMRQRLRTPPATPPATAGTQVDPKIGG